MGHLSILKKYLMKTRFYSSPLGIPNDSAKERKNEEIALGLLSLGVALSALTSLLVPNTLRKRVSSLSLPNASFKTFLGSLSAEAQEAGHDNWDFCCKRAEKTGKE